METQARPRIRELRLRWFRAFENARLKLDDHTVIIGRNGSGKTTIMEAFEFVQDAVSHSLLTALERRGGLGAIRHRNGAAQGRQADIQIAVDIELPHTRALYGFVLATAKGETGFRVKREILRSYPKTSFSFERRGQEFHTSVERVQAPGVSPEALVLPLVAEQEPVWGMVLTTLRQIGIYSFSPPAMQAEPLIGSREALAKDGANIGDVLRRLDQDKEAMEWIIRHLHAIVPGITGVRAKAAAGRRIIEFLQTSEDKTVRFAASEMSYGTLHSLGVLLALRQKPSLPLVCIDEIEASIHTAALSVLMEAARETSEDRCQVLVSSHSTDALSHSSVQADNVRIIDRQGPRSLVFQTAEAVRQRMKPPETVGRLLRSNALWTEDVPDQVSHDIFEVKVNEP